MPLKIGILGFGVVGSRRFEILKNIPNLSIVAVSDQKKENLVGLDNSIALFDDYITLIETIDFDVAFVSLPNLYAKDATARALKKGSHVFCEKPPARTSAELNEIISISRANPSLKLMYGFNHRFHESAILAKQVIDSKQLGKIVNLKGTYGKSKIITFDQTDWRSKRNQAGGGILLDQGIHMLDLISYFSNQKFTEIHSFVDNAFWGHDVEDNAFAIMRSDEGIVAQIHSSATQWRHKFNLEITLQQGSIIMQGILSGSKSYGEEELIIIRHNPDSRDTSLDEKIETFKNDLSWDKEINYFLHAITNDKPIKTSNIDDAMKIMQLIEKIYESDSKWAERVFE